MACRPSLLPETGSLEQQELASQQVAVLGQFSVSCYNCCLRNSPHHTCKVHGELHPAPFNAESVEVQEAGEELPGGTGPGQQTEQFVPPAIRPVVVAHVGMNRMG